MAEVPYELIIKFGLIAVLIITRRTCNSARFHITSGIQ